MRTRSQPCGLSEGWGAGPGLHSVDRVTGQLGLLLQVLGGAEKALASWECHDTHTPKPTHRYAYAYTQGLPCTMCKCVFLSVWVKVACISAMLATTQETRRPAGSSYFPCSCCLCGRPGTRNKHTQHTPNTHTQHTPNTPRTDPERGMREMHTGGLIR